jgi:hypothetical protein
MSIRISNTCAPHIICLLLLCLTTAAYAGQYRFGVKGEQVLLNGQPFKVIGLRVSNALISDQTADQLIDHLDVFKRHGVNTVSVYVMGSRFGNVKGYRPDSTLDPVYAARLAKIIEAADQRGMVVLVGCLYWGTSTANDDLRHWRQPEANAAIANTVAWLSRKDYRNVFIDIDNEGMCHEATKWSLSEMIDAAHRVDRSIMIAYNARPTPPDNADLLVHFSPKSKGRPWIESEGTPPGESPNYWGSYSKRDRYDNYIRIGRYSPEMKAHQLKETFETLDQHAGYIMASTWLQCGPAEGVNGPFHTPGGLALTPNPDQSTTQLHPDAGILWWLEALQSKHGPYQPHRPRP